MRPESTFPFFVGRGRSGTTLLRAIFDSHSELAIPPETHFVPSMGRALYERGGEFAADLFIEDLYSRRDFSTWNISRSHVHEAFEQAPPRSSPEALRAIYALYAREHGKTRYADKTPNYIFHMPLLARLFPEARFVHVIRDGRDVYLSRREAGFKPASPEGNAILWKEFVTRGRTDGSKLGASHYCEIRYEDLLSDPEGRIRSLCSFLELHFEPEMLQFYERAESVVGPDPHHRNIYKPLLDSARDWSKEIPLHELATFECIAGDLLGELGYPRGLESISLTTRFRAGYRQLRFSGGKKVQVFRRKVGRTAKRVGRALQRDGGS